MAMSGGGSGSSYSDNISPVVTLLTDCNDLGYRRKDVLDTLVAELQWMRMATYHHGPLTHDTRVPVDGAVLGHSPEYNIPHMFLIFINQRHKEFLTLTVNFHNDCTFRVYDLTNLVVTACTLKIMLDTLEVVYNVTFARKPYGNYERFDLLYFSLLDVYYMPHYWGMYDRNLTTCLESGECVLVACENLHDWFTLVWRKNYRLNTEPVVYLHSKECWFMSRTGIGIGGFTTIVDTVEAFMRTKRLTPKRWPYDSHVRPACTYEPYSIVVDDDDDENTATASVEIVLQDDDDE